MAFQAVAHLIPEDVPIILETPVELAGMAAELERVGVALPVRRSSLLA